MKVVASTRNDNLKRLNEIYKVLKKNDFGYHQDCDGKIVCNVSYVNYLKQGINAFC